MARQPKGTKRHRIISGSFLLLFFTLISSLLFIRAMNQSFSHDEHQFVASAVLFSDEGALPYRDYPHHHMPNLVFIYGLLFKLTRYHLLAARAFSALCAAISAGILFFLAISELKHWSILGRYLIGVLVVVLLLTNPLFYLTSGKAWNHDLPTLLVLIVFLLCRQGFQKPRPRLWFFASGVLLGLAVGTRLTYLFTVVPFLGMIFLYPDDRSRELKLRSILYFILGMVLGLAPVFVLFILAPEGFIFGNYVYPRLHTVYQTLQRVNTGISAGGKIGHFTSSVLTDPLNLILYGGYLLFFIGFARSKRLNKMTKFYFIFSGVLVLALLVGAFTPTPSLEHYFYAPVPFIIFGVVLGFAGIERMDRNSLALVLLIVFFTIYWQMTSTNGAYRFNTLADPEAWIPYKVHALGEELAGLVGDKRVLTLAPLIPLESQVEIYPEFATGPFTWRVAALLSPDRQLYYQVVSKETLSELLAEKPPGGILVGFEDGNDGFEFGDPGGLEKPLADYAIEYGYQSFTLPADWVSNPVVLWIR